MAKKKIEQIVEEQAEVSVSETVEATVDEVSEPVEETVEEVISEPVVDAEPAPIRADFVVIRAEAGDSYLSIAERHGGGRDLAEAIAKKNGHAPVRQGVKLIVPVV